MSPSSPILFGSAQIRLHCSRPPWQPLLMQVMTAASSLPCTTSASADGVTPPSWKHFTSPIGPHSHPPTHWWLFSISFSGSSSSALSLNTEVSCGSSNRFLLFSNSSHWWTHLGVTYCLSIRDKFLFFSKGNFILFLFPTIIQLLKSWI